MYHGNLRGPLSATAPPRNKPLLRDYENPLVSLNKVGVFSGRLFLVGFHVALGGSGPLDCHDKRGMADFDVSRLLAGLQRGGIAGREWLGTRRVIGANKNKVWLILVG